ncbi:energy transducer TonB [Psychroserpens sp.]|uniref:energy transducer TonB family protein n=1 Tax=Psychroserpens sp. TaxID=2020870 RepID=UPI001B22E5C4|nr:energy transducer TonB [Psychroserpens sp.]MBO6605626.1 energy transducer TonB [Psychroserpens sp.]MBO6631171.1 energy transducer TonB [Psychroserpens sp.]MBO6653565.1 energy transducer TonB [Psychroserpens sp.]MBO6681886.1 energy transducer TonB [Psychroserpens sp.]MBO6749000.1 energy transducer TonB [Psychroserpens sp.]
MLLKHKALLITILISGTLVMAMFSFHIKKNSQFIAESFYEIEPQTEEELEALEAQKQLEEQANLNPKTNQAFNEDEAFKEMMRNFKTVNSNDFEEAPTEPESELEPDATSESIITADRYANNASNYALNETDRNSFNKANSVLESQTSNKENSETESNRNSSVSYSLSNRDKVSLPPPVYLCEVTGKIVVNITVNAAGKVTDTYINSNSSSDNECLIDYALQYAQNARFSSAERASQIGSITYYFQGKN